MPRNFSAAYALVFCAGLYLPGRMSWIFTLCLMAGTEFLLQFLFYTQGHFSLGTFLVDEAPNLLAYSVLIALGRWFGPKRSWAMLVGGGVMGAMLFYIITNTGAWLVNPRYAKTLAGWVQAITIGLPEYPQTWEFFRNTLLSGGIFTGLFVGAMKLTAEKEAQDEAKEEKESAPAPELDGEPEKVEQEG